jgi:Family of unknown function (DUF5996)
MLEKWPELAFEGWKDTRNTLHLWMQVVGKVKLELCPFLNQWWQVAFFQTARGLTTGPIPWREESFEVNFDFIDHRVVINVSDGRKQEMTLEPRTVADFYRLFMQALGALGIQVSISTLPAEIPDAIHFEKDTTHAAYDKTAAHNWWRILLATSRVMDRFRTPFHGKSSPVQFFWGGFDLDATRFNGKSTPPPANGGRIMAYGENEENFAIGFWPGTEQFPNAAFYAYIVPAPARLAEAAIQPKAAHYDATLGEFILLYSDVRDASSPEEALRAFFQSTYEACVTLAGWDRAALEGNVPDLAQA